MNMVWNGMDIYGPNLSFMMLQGKEMANALQVVAGQPGIVKLDAHFSSRCR